MQAVGSSAVAAPANVAASLSSQSGPSYAEDSWPSPSSSPAEPAQEPCSSESPATCTMLTARSPVMAKPSEDHACTYPPSVVSSGRPTKLPRLAPADTSSRRTYPSTTDVVVSYASGTPSQSRRTAVIPPVDPPWS